MLKQIYPKAVSHMKKALIIIISVVIVALGVVAGIRFVKPVETNEQISETHTTEAITVMEKITDEDASELVSNEGLLNILLVGQDKREGESRQRSDTMILCSFNPETNKLSMISFLRDLYVEIPGYEDNRLNAAYALGGFELLKETIALNFGIKIDGCLESDFEGFEKIIDTVGGVDINLTSEEAKIVGLSEGTHTLNGEQALTYARIRKIDSDFQRTERQRNIMNAVFEKAKKYQLMELAGFFGEILPLMTTDMTEDEIMTFALTLASSFEKLEINSYAVPSQGNYTSETIRDMAVLVPNLEEIRKLIFEEYLPL